MTRQNAFRASLAALTLFLTPVVLHAQHGGDEHARHHPPATAATARATPRETGQAAFAALAEVVRLLDADSTTDWNRVDLEALRRHLVDMDEVTMRGEVTQERVDGGARFTVRGPARTAAAIRRVATAHAAMLAPEQGYGATVEEVEGGARITVRAAAASDVRAVARIRALGFVGLLVTGAHHGPHHLAMARGEAHAHH